MKKIAVLFAMIAVVAIAASTVVAKEETMNKGAKIYTMMGPVPGAVKVEQPYVDSIHLYTLQQGDQAFWNPDGGKYIVNGDISFLWCSVFKKGNEKPVYRWIAVGEESFDKAVDVGHTFQGGIAFFKLTSDGKQIALEAVPFTTLQAIAGGEKTIDVNE